MSDPAVEAVKRADPDGWLRPAEYAEAAAREALAPIRELHRAINQYLPCEASEIHGEAFEDATGEWCCPVCTRHDGGPQKVCAECRDEEGLRVDWPSPTDRLIYTTEELEACRAE